MAAGFKTATVASGDVPSTQTNFPSYVDLSRLGITTLAEAQSVRVYADSAKTTEWAREIVSATEMHVKVPSFTSTTSIYVDWDGVRADYAVTDTYGRNNVWSDYATVHHLEGNSNDSSGNGRNGTDTAITYGSQKVGQGASFAPGSNSVITLGSFAYTSSYTYSLWFYKNNHTNVQELISKDNGSTRVFTAIVNATTGTSDTYAWLTSGITTPGTTAALTTGSWQHYTFVLSGSSYSRNLFNGSQTQDATITNNASTTSFATWYGRDQFSGGRWTFDGAFDEIRLKKSASSNDWVLTEYNNQSDEAGFWGTWSTVGGGGSPTPLRMLMGVGS